MSNNNYWDDMIALAEKHGANETAARLERYIGFNMNVIAVPIVEKSR
jgi:hypothetical protein